VQRSYSRTCQIIGDRGTIRWDYLTGEVRWLSVETSEWKVFPNPHGWETNQMYSDEMQHFLKCVAGSEETVQNIFEAKRVLEVALAAKTSAKEGKMVRIQQ